MSDLFKPEDDQQNTSDNSQEFFNSGGSSPSPSLSDSVLSETSLPEFTGEEALDVPRVRSSEAAPLGLNELLSVPRAEAESKAKAQDSTFATRPSYKVSPATSDLSNYPVPGLEDESPDEVEVEKSSGWKTTWAIIREVGETVILTLIIFLIIQMVVRNFRVVGTSMVNNLQDGQYLIIDKISYTPWVSDYLGMGGPQRGDVIVFEPPRRPDEDYVKRIIALPGEKVQVIKGEVYINDQLVEEPFAPNPASYTMPKPVIVPQEEVFVLGDNRNNSNDSHNWGTLPVENIVGRAWLSYWPPDLWGTIPRDIPTEEATLKYTLEQFIPNANAKNE